MLNLFAAAFLGFLVGAAVAWIAAVRLNGR